MNNTITRRIYGSSTATTNDLAHIDVGYRCRLVGYLLSLTSLAIINTDSVRMQLSVSSVGALTTNDPQGVLAELSNNYFVTTSGGGNMAVISTLSGLAIVLPAGTRVYIHTLQVGTSACACVAILYLEPF